MFSQRVPKTSEVAPHARHQEGMTTRESEPRLVYPPLLITPSGTHAGSQLSSLLLVFMRPREPAKV